MGRTRIDGDQVQDESLTGDDVLDESLKAVDLDIQDVASGIANDPIAEATIIQLINYGKNFTLVRKNTTETFSGGQFQTYETLAVNISETDPVNRYRFNAFFRWSHNSASNDIRFRLVVDGSAVSEELRIEPKDANGDQRFQNNMLHYLDNLSAGNHTIDLQVRPASANRVSTVYSCILEFWRVE